MRRRLPRRRSRLYGIYRLRHGITWGVAANHIPASPRAEGCRFQARATRRHKNANVLCLGERVTGQGVALDIAELFLSTAFEGRHIRRVSRSG